MFNVQNKVRLKDFELKAITELFAKHFLTTDHIWLFGSRANLDKRGGDIDLYIETSIPAEQTYKKKLDFIVDLCSKIGDQKIDVVINVISDSEQLAIYEIARTEGIQLA